MAVTRPLKPTRSSGGHQSATRRSSRARKPSPSSRSSLRRHRPPPLPRPTRFHRHSPRAPTTKSSARSTAGEWELSISCGTGGWTGWRASRSSMSRCSNAKGRWIASNGKCARQPASIIPTSSPPTVLPRWRGCWHSRWNTWNSRGSRADSYRMRPQPGVQSRRSLAGLGQLRQDTHFVGCRHRAVAPRITRAHGLDHGRGVLERQSNDCFCQPRRLATFLGDRQRCRAANSAAGNGGLVEHGGQP